MGCVQSYFRKAHNAGLSPSSTQGSDNAGLIDESPTEPKKQLIREDQPLKLALPVQLTSIPAINIEDDHPPGTNGSSKTGTGLLGPGIAALAASTGTVAILGATADKTKAALEGAVQSVGEGVDGLATRADKVREDATQVAVDVHKGVQESVENVTDAVRGEAEILKEGVDDAVDTVVQEGDNAKQQVEAVVEKARLTKDELVTNAEEMRDNVLKEADQGKDDLLRKAEQVKDDLVAKTEQVKDEIVTKAVHAKVDLATKIKQAKDDLAGAEDQFVAKTEQVKDEIVTEAVHAKDDLATKIKQAKDDLAGAEDQFVAKAEQVKDDLVAKTEQVKDEMVTKAVHAKDDLATKVKQAEDDLEGAKDQFLAKTEQVKDEMVTKAVHAKDDLATKVKQAEDDLEGAKDQFLAKTEQVKDEMVTKAVHAKDNLAGKVEGVKDDLAETKDRFVAKTAQVKDEIVTQAVHAKDDLIGKVEQTKNDVAEKVKQEEDGVLQRIEVTKENVENEVEKATQEFESFAEKAHQTTGDLVDKVDQAEDVFVHAVEEDIQNHTNIFKEKTDQIQSHLSGKVDQSQEDIAQKVENITRGAETSVKEAKDGLTEKVDQTKEDVEMVETNVINKAAALVENVNQTQTDLVKSADQIMTDVINDVAIVGQEVDILAAKVDQTTDTLSTEADNVFNKVVDLKESAEKDVLDEIESLKGAAEQTSENVAHVREIAQKEVDEVVELAERVVEEAGSTSVSPHDLLERLSRPSSKKTDIRSLSTEVEAKDVIDDEELQRMVTQEVEAEDESFPEPPPPERETNDHVEVTTGGRVEDQISPSTSEKIAVESVNRLPRVIDVETIVKDTTKAASHGDMPLVLDMADSTEHSEVTKVLAASALELADTAATTIQATFRGHHTRQSLRKIADDGQENSAEKTGDMVTDNLDDFPPPPMDELAADEKEMSESSSENKVDLQPVIDVTIRADAQPGRSDSITESDKTFEEKSTLPAESEAESVDEVIRAASTLSESTMSLGDSLSALKGSETDSVNALSETSEEAAEKLGTAATTIQASFRGFQTRQNLQKIADDSQLPLPDPLQELPFEDPIDEDDLPPPPDEYDIDDLHEHVDDVSTSTPRSPETGEKLIRTSSGDGGEHLEPYTITAEALALLQRPQECDELPEHRGDVPLSTDVENIVEDELLSTRITEESGGEIGKAASKDAASSAEVDDSSLSSAATKIQAGARGYLSRKHMNDTFSTTAPSMTDSQQSVGTVLTSQDDDAVQTSGSLETEVQRQSLDVSENLGVTAVVIANASNKDEKEIEVSSKKALSLDSQPVERKKKISFKAAQSMQCPGPEASAEDQQVWQTLQSGLEDAATTIQSNFRGFRTRQRLQRENAVQMPTTSSGTPATSESSDAQPAIVRSSGEFHDMLVLPTTETTHNNSSVGYDALAPGQTSTIGNHPEGHVTLPDDVRASGGVGVAQNIVIKMGKATEVEPALAESREASMKGESAVNAATKIQAGFRGYKVRKQMKLDQAPTKRKRRGSHNIVVGQEKVRNKEASLQDRSATKIQAGVRGFLVRKRRQEERNAAVKIQAGFRGYKVRRDGKRAPVEK